MNVFVFSSKDLNSILIGVKSRCWAVSQKQAAMNGLATKAEAMPIGAFGLFYCKETQSFTTPFVVRSKPQAGVTINSIWSEPQEFSFGILPLGSPEQQLHKDKARDLLPTLMDREVKWNYFLQISPPTVFLPSPISDQDWEVIVDHLAIR